MKDDKLTALLKALRKKEQHAFRKFLLSPFFNQREDVLVLYDLLRKELKRKQPRLEPDWLFGQVYPDIDFTDKQFYLLKSYLYKLLEQFLSIQAYMDDSYTAKLDLSKIYQQRGLDSSLKYHLGQLEKQFNEEKRRDRYYYEKYREFLLLKNQIGEVQQPSKPLLFTGIAQATDSAYLAHKLRQLCLIMAHQAVYTVNYTLVQEEEAKLFALIETGSYLEIPAIAIYFHGYFLLGDRDGNQHFPAFKSLLFEQEHCFAASELKELYLLAINYCIKQVNKGEVKFFEDMLSLYQQGFHLGVLIEDQKISRFSFHNVVAAALQTRSFDWAAYFIDNYHTYLDESYRESSYRYNLAKLAFEKREFDKALEQLRGISVHDLLLNLGAKVISLKIYYTLGEYDLLDAHLNAMNNFVRRNKMLGYHRKNYLNIIRLTKKLLDLNPYDDEAKTQLKKVIQEEPILTERNWLLAQLEPTE